MDGAFVRAGVERCARLQLQLAEKDRLQKAEQRPGRARRLAVSVTVGGARTNAAAIKEKPGTIPSRAFCFAGLTRYSAAVSGAGRASRSRCSSSALAMAASRRALILVSRSVATRR